MSKKRGLSVEEKRTRMMEFFYEKKDFFQLKELEKMCHKEKGITSMSVKEILMSLVDDSMVDTEKIGTCVYFWAFPSKASQNRKRKIDELTRSLEDSNAKKNVSENSVKKAKVGREDTGDRAEIMGKLESLRQKKAHISTEVAKYKECDPEVMQHMKEETATAKEAANRWTDNIFSTKSWIKKKFSFEDKMLDKQFGIPEDFDYID